MAVYPQVTELCARFVKQQAPGLKFSSIACFEGLLAAPHLDPSNSCLPNVVIALSKFTGGEIWVHSKTGNSFREVEGCMLPGVRLSLQVGHALFDASQSVRATEPWNKERVVLVAFCVKLA